MALLNQNHRKKPSSDMNPQQTMGDTSKSGEANKSAMSSLTQRQRQDQTMSLTEMLYQSIQKDQKNQLRQENIQQQSGVLINGQYLQNGDDQSSNQHFNTAGDAGIMQEEAVNLSKLPMDKDLDDRENQSLLDKNNNQDQLKLDQLKGYEYRIQGENSIMFGNPRQQAIWQFLTVHHTNIFRDQGIFFLLLIRGFQLSMMIWLLYIDIKRHGIKFKYFTVWGAQATIWYFCLMFIITLQKAYEQAIYNRSTERRALVEEMLNSRTLWYLDSFTAWLFQFAFISELAISICFWVWLYLVDSDVKSMTTKQLNDKIYFDVISDLTNYDHSMPILMLIIEYGINNIPFTWLNWLLMALVQYSYIMFQWFYSVEIVHKLVYDFMDWYNHPWKCLLLGSGTLIVSTFLTVIFIEVTKCKVKSATGINYSKEL